MILHARAGAPLWLGSCENIGTEGKSVSQAALVIRHLHLKGIVHRAIKPENFLLKDGRLSSRGCVLHWCCPVGKRQCPLGHGAELPGRCGVSVQDHGLRFLEPGRGTKVLLYLLTGSLPWDEEDEIGEKIVRKVATCAEELAEECPRLGSFWDHCRGLGPEELPHYGLLRSILVSFFFPLLLHVFSPNTFFWQVDDSACSCWCPSLAWIL
mmetsp:Transcript_65493/g.143650  ORF Transcript_65493/g.143650 Transcript_65493/m.143650 type:complete len:210 (-) Transcript_65493:364-993(-)